MKPRLVLTVPQPADVLFVAENLRDADRLELETATQVSSTEALFKAWALSELSWIGNVDGIPAIIFGVCQKNIIWMVCTKDIQRIPKLLLKASKDCLDELLKVYPYLHNQADCRNVLHLRWIEFLGFTFGPTVDINGFPFQRFFISSPTESQPCVNPQPSSLA